MPNQKHIEASRCNASKRGRAFYKALHELKLVQARRAGRPVPEH